MSNFAEGKFQFQSIKSIFWSQIVNGGQGAVERGFSKEGLTSLLATDERFSVLSKAGAASKLHIPIYPGYQTFPENLRPTKAPVHRLLGEKDNVTGTTGCYEIEKKLKAANTLINVTEYRGAHHGWDEDFVPRRADDGSSENCRWVLKDGGGVWSGDQKPLGNAADNQAYFKSCTKQATLFVGRNEAANKNSRQAVIDIAKSTFK